jgi:DeoR family fructose operon transcriptional repressor
LIEILKEQPGIRVPDLARLLEVSEGTIRNDMKALAESGQLMRVWGGAVPLAQHEEPVTPYAARTRMNQPAKNAIAREAARLVEDGDSVLLDASTTVFSLAGYLQERRGLTVVTNGIEVGRELARNPSNVVVLLGGVLRTDGTAVTRPVSETILKDLHIKTAFVSSSGFNLENGLTEVDFLEAQFKRAMVDAALRLVALIDASKFGRIDLTPFAPANRIDHLYTDREISAEWIERLTQAGIAFTVC